MIETIKLAKQYKLDTLFRACETHFKELMVQSFDCTNLITLKQGGPGQRDAGSSGLGGGGGPYKRNKHP